MDNHPIPQDVTGFKFKLIGSMTVKQFAYVAAGVITSVILYYLPLKGIAGGLIKALLIPVSFGSGIMIAFLPIDGRPMDVMLGNFIKAVFSPNQYLYHKNGRRFSFMTISLPTRGAFQNTQQTMQDHPTHTNTKNKQLREFLDKNKSPEIKNNLDNKELAFLKSLASSYTQTPALQQHAATQPPIQQPPQPASIQKAENQTIQEPIARPVQKTTPAVQTAPVQPPLTARVANPEPTKNTNPQNNKPEQLKQQIQNAHDQKKLLENELSKLKNQLQEHKPETPTTAVSPSSAPIHTTPNPTHVRSIPKESVQKMGILVPDSPNVVVGIVKDPRGNILQNILVEITDKDGNAVRAFKTNALGQFASATPLPTGSYTVTLEDPRNQHKFDSIKIAARDQVMLPIEIISYDKREELRRDLFN